LRAFGVTGLRPDDWDDDPLARSRTRMGMPVRRRAMTDHEPA